MMPAIGSLWAARLASLGAAMLCAPLPAAAQAGRYDSATGTFDLLGVTGQPYRMLRDETVPMFGGVAIVVILAGLLLIALIRGRIKIESGRSGRRIARFDALERTVHWLTALSFLVLGCTGLNSMLGERTIAPMIGSQQFSTLTAGAKIAHEYAGYAFLAGIVIMFSMWVHDNFPSRLDLRWLALGGSLVGRRHPVADRFNGGQKIFFWLVMALGSVLIGSGFIMLLRPDGLTIAGFEIASIIHAAAAMALFALVVGHAYIRSVAMEGAFDAMGRGKVDLNWAKQHHGIWADKVALRQTRNEAGASKKRPK